MQVCKYASMQVCKYASMQVSKYDAAIYGIERNWVENIDEAFEEEGRSILWECLVCCLRWYWKGCGTDSCRCWANNSTEYIEEALEDRMKKELPNPVNDAAIDDIENSGVEICEKKV